MNIVISSGHGKYIRGASGYLDEVDEARRVVDRVATLLEGLDIGVVTFHDDISTTQSENLNRIVSFHNSQTRDLDVSVHFNAYQTTSKPMGCEVLYVSSSGLKVAEIVVNAICNDVEFINRGPKKRTDLAFLNGTEEIAVLIETCFVDSKADHDIYNANFEAVCEAIAESLSGQTVEPIPPDSPAAPEPPIPPVPDSDVEHIKDIANSSVIARYAWRDRGVAPVGYMQGFALAWSTVVRKYLGGNAAAVEMAKANTHNDDLDALSWYNSNFAALGMRNDAAGLNTLRHLFVLLMGLGMRESSGRHCEGRDMSASNVTADTAEAGLYQTSYNAHTSHLTFDQVMADYEAERYPDYKVEFAEGVSCTSSEWQNYGSGRGAKFQDMCKKQPPFAVESCAIVLRNRRQHYGPINRKEAEIKMEADQMLMEVQRYIEGTVEPTLEQRVSYLEAQVIDLEARVTELEDNA